MRGEAFKNTSVLEEILGRWHDRYGTCEWYYSAFLCSPVVVNVVNVVYVPAHDYDHSGPQVPFKDGTLAIGVFHQMHCLVSYFQNLLA